MEMPIGRQCFKVRTERCGLVFLPRVSDEAETLSAPYLAARFTDVLRPVRKTVARHLDGGNCGSVDMVSSFVGEAYAHGYVDGEYMRWARPGHPWIPYSIELVPDLRRYNWLKEDILPAVDPHEEREPCRIDNILHSFVS